MKTANDIKKEIEMLTEAFKEKLISVNDYCTMYHTLSKKLKSLE